jgi:uncharacterized protein (TIGR02996 family)
MRTFERRDDRGRRFWNIERQGGRLTVTYGRAGARGQTQVMDYPDAAQAEAAEERRAREKLAEGYVETTRAPLPPLRRALEEALVADPEDVAAHMAYADWLSEQDDPFLRARGQFIQVQLALEDEGRPAAERKRLVRREQALLDLYRQRWLGDLAPFLLPPGDETPLFHFVRGWLDSLHVPRLRVDLARALASAPEVRLLRQLVVLDCAPESAANGDFQPGNDVPPDERYPSLYALRRAPFLGNLRVLQLGDTEGDADFRPCPGGEAVAEWFPLLPRLQELTLHLGNLERAVVPDGKTLQELRVLRLDGQRLGDEGCRGIVRSGILRHLKVLQLWNADIADSGARILAQCPDLRNLEALDVSFNPLTRAGIDALKATGVNVQPESPTAPGTAELYSDHEDFE